MVMSLATAKYFPAHTEQRRRARHDPGWTSWLPVSRGLGMVATGYRALLLGGIVGTPFLWLGVHEGPWIEWLAERKHHPRTFLILGLIVLGLTALLSYAFVFRGYA